MKTLKVKYAQLPVISTEVWYLIEIVEPIPFIPVRRRVDLDAWMADREDAVKFAALDLYHKSTYASLESDAENIEKMKWIHPIKDVELIECHLLVPKNETTTCAACGSRESSWNLDGVD